MYLTKTVSDRPSGECDTHFENDRTDQYDEGVLENSFQLVTGN